MNKEETQPIDWKSFEAYEHTCLINWKKFEAYGHTYWINAYGRLYVQDPDSRAFNPVPTTTQADGETYWIVQDSEYLRFIPCNESYQRAFPGINL